MTLTGYPKIGLTGGIASGKSTVAGWLAEAGFRVIDADDLVAGLYGAGQPGAAAVRELFGDGALDANGAVDHLALAELVFSDAEALDRLEESIHPLVRQAFARIVDEADRPCVLEATLLVEAGYAPDFDFLVTVEADVEKRIARAVARGLQEEEVRARLEAQASREFRSRAAHRVLTNNGSLDDLQRATYELVAELRQRLPRREDK